MDIKSGDLIFVHHYSVLKPIKSCVDESGDEIIVVTPLFYSSITLFYEGDPLTFKYDNKDKIIIVGCNILEINNTNKHLKLNYEQIKIDTNNREYERYPVSLYAYIKSPGLGEESLTIIKNVSNCGLLAYSKDDLPTDKEYQFTLHIGKQVVFINCIIIRKEKGLHYFEYGMYISFNNAKAMKIVRDYVQNQI